MKCMCHTCNVQELRALLLRIGGREEASWYLVILYEHICHAHLEISDPYNINFERKQDRHQQNQCSDEIPRGSGGDREY